MRSLIFSVWTYYNIDWTIFLVRVTCVNNDNHDINIVFILPVEMAADEMSYLYCMQYNINVVNLIYRLRKWSSAVIGGTILVVILRKNILFVICGSCVC